MHTVHGWSKRETNDHWCETSVCPVWLAKLWIVLFFPQTEGGELIHLVVYVVIIKVNLLFIFFSQTCIVKAVQRSKKWWRIEFKWVLLMTQEMQQSCKLLSSELNKNKELKKIHKITSMESCATLFTWCYNIPLKPYDILCLNALHNCMYKF